MNISLETFDHTKALAKQRKLFLDAFPEQIGSPGESTEHYMWKFHQFPAPKTSWEFSAKHEEELVAYYAALPFPYKLGSRLCTVGMVCDVMTHSAHRGRGLFTKIGAYSLEQMKRDGIDLVTGYPIRPEVLPGHLKVGWKVAFDLPLYVKVLRTNSAFRKIHVPFLGYLVNPLFRSYSMLCRTFASPRNKIPYEYEQVEVTDFLHNENVDEFLKSWGKEVPNHLVKTREFYKWRLGAPCAEYQVFIANRGSQIVSLGITRRYVRDGIPTLAILDLMVLQEHRGCLSGMHRKIEEAAHELEADVIASMMSKKRANEYALLATGFIRSPLKFQLINKALNDSLKHGDLNREENWHLMWIDSDDL